MAPQSGTPPSMVSSENTASLLTWVGAPLEQSIADAEKAAQSPPYAPTVWALGGPPVRSVDLPAQTIFLILFLIGATIHMRIYLQNKSRGHKFIPNMCMFGKSLVCTRFACP